MTLVSGDDRPRARVGPKVFADVPTRAELEEARGGKSTFVMISVLLAGMLIAACVGLYIFGKDAAGIPKMVEKHGDQVKGFEDRIAELEQTNREQFQEYRIIDERRATAAKIRDTIKQLLEERPAASSRAVGTVYDTPSAQGAWPELRTAAESRLEREIEQLRQIEQNVRAYRGAAVASTPDEPQ